MAKIPSQLARNTPRVGRSIAGYDASQVGRTLSSIGRDMQGGLNDLSKGFEVAAAEVDRLQLQDDRRSAVDLENEFAKRISTIQYGDSTEANPGYFNLRGQAALDGYEGSTKKIEDVKQELLKKAKNKRVRDIFSLAADQRQTTEVEQMTKYTSDQRKVAEDTTSAVRLQQAADDVAAAPGNDEVRARSFAIVDNEMINKSKREGWSKEITAQAIKDGRTNVLLAEISAAVVNDPEGADIIYQKHKHMMNGQQRTEVEKMLSTQVLAAKAQSWAEEALAAHPGDIKAGRQYIRDKLSGKNEEAAIQEYDQRWAEARAEITWEATLENLAYNRLARQNAQYEREQRIAADQAGDSLYEWLRAGKGTRTEWESLNPAMATDLIKNSYLSETMDRTATRLELAAEFSDITRSESVQMYASMNFEQLAQVSDGQLEMEKANYKQTDWVKLVNKVTAARNFMENALGPNSKVFTAADEILGQQVPRNKKGKSKLSDEQYNQVQLELHSFVSNQIKNGKYPTNEDIEKEAIRLMLPIVSDPQNTGQSWFGIEGKFELRSPEEGEEDFEGLVADYEYLSPQQKAIVTVPVDSIPKSIIVDLKGLLKERNIPVTNSLLEQLAGAYAVKDKERFERLLSGK